MGKDGKPKGKMTAYAYFVQTCREEHRKKNPSDQIVFTEFSKKCGEKWKAMTAKDKKRFDDMALKDKARYDNEMHSYVPPEGGAKGGKRGKKTKDPNAPKRALSGFFFFCNEERTKVKAQYPSYAMGETAKELGRRWEACVNRAKYEAMAVKDRARYEKEMSLYKAGAGGPAKKAKPAAAAVPVDDDDDDEDDDEDYEDESDE